MVEHRTSRPRVARALAGPAVLAASLAVLAAGCGAPGPTAGTAGIVSTAGTASTAGTTSTAGTAGTPTAAASSPADVAMPSDPVRPSDGTSPTGSPSPGGPDGTASPGGTPSTSDCTGPTGLPDRGARLSDASVVTGAVVCMGAVAVEASPAQARALAAALALPQPPRTRVACSDLVRRDRPSWALRTSDGSLIRPATPTDSCGKPIAQVQLALQAVLAGS